ncbi:MAG: 3-isopropylmalate dehydratase small subunit [Clostridiales Family XIII bacterium]|jgi:3-isopropylmalate/(R)-2-methylmalate dehydratase small subunit|nr:3-isopropylmalate dehydratase small subunit [Clostridiales Family XIII bacterium]
MMGKVYQGKAFTFGDNVNTESIMASSADHGAHLPIAECLRFYDPNFAKEMSSGDFIVAGKNFGNSSSRPAALVLKAMDLRAIICESSARIFYRNTWNIGVPVLECPGVLSIVERGDELAVDIENGQIKNLTNGKEIQAEAPIPLLLERWEVGGMIEWIKQHPENYPTVIKFHSAGVRKNVEGFFGEVNEADAVHDKG